MGACVSKVEDAVNQGEHMVCINLTHISGGEKQWCMNNVIVIDANGNFLSHSENLLWHQWNEIGESVVIDCPNSARFIAFASQDMTSCKLQVVENTSTTLSLPSNPVNTIHWSNGAHACKNWNSDCNANERMWAYTVVPFAVSGEEPPRAPFHSSWDDLKYLKYP